MQIDAFMRILTKIMAKKRLRISQNKKNTWKLIDFVLKFKVAFKSKGGISGF